MTPGGRHEEGAADTVSQAGDEEAGGHMALAHGARSGAVQFLRLGRTLRVLSGHEPPVTILSPCRRQRLFEIPREREDEGRAVQHDVLAVQEATLHR